MLLISWRATVEEVNNNVQKKLDASGANLGYRTTWTSLERQKIPLRMKDVRKSILGLSAEGVQQRK